MNVNDTARVWILFLLIGSAAGGACAAILGWISPGPGLAASLGGVGLVTFALTRCDRGEEEE